MERLTKLSRHGDRYVSAIGSGAGCWGEIVNRLAAYENTGLEPEYITELLADANAMHAELAALKQEKAARENPAALTLDELQQMEGEPVWADHWHGGEWIIVHWNYARSIASTCKACLHEHEYGKSWFAYRNKPKEAGQ